MTDNLYRGVNEELYRATQGRLVPKARGERFERSVHFGGRVYYGDGSVYGKSERNAVLMHQHDSTKYPTSGVSTTPNYEHAVRYAGYVYKISATLLEAYGVKSFSVDQHAARPVIPGDREVILVASDFGPLPNENIAEVIRVCPPEKEGPEE
jgi:hypothetical protein